MSTTHQLFNGMGIVVVDVAIKLAQVPFYCLNWVKVILDTTRAILCCAVESELSCQ